MQATRCEFGRGRSARRCTRLDPRPTPSTVILREGGVPSLDTKAHCPPARRRQRAPYPMQGLSGEYSPVATGPGSSPGQNTSSPPEPSYSAKAEYPVSIPKRTAHLHEGNRVPRIRCRAFLGRMHSQKQAPDQVRGRSTPSPPAPSYSAKAEYPASLPQRYSSPAQHRDKTSPIPPHPPLAPMHWAALRIRGKCGRRRWRRCRRPVLPSPS